MKSSNIVQKVIFVFFLYSFLFALPFNIGGFSYNGFLILRLIAVVYVVFNLNEFKRFYHKYHKEANIMIIIVGYSLVRSLAAGDMQYGITDLTGIFALFVIPFFLISYGRHLGIRSIEVLVNYLLIAVTLAVASSIAALLLPSFSDFLRNRMLEIEEDNYMMINSYRGYGWGAGLLSHYSYTIGIVSIVGTIYNKYANWYKFVFPFAIVAILINARTGVIVAIIGLIVFFLRSGSMKSAFLTLVVSAFGVFFFSGFLDFVLHGQERTLEWIENFFLTTDNYFHGEQTGAVDTLLNKMVYFPNNLLGWLFGEGTTLFYGYTYNGSRINSDIGFVNHLFFGGLVYCYMLYYLVYVICNKLRKKNQKALWLFFFLTFLLLNTKSSLLFNTYSFGAIVLVYFAALELGSVQQSRLVKYK